MRLLLACTCLTPVTLLLSHAAALAETSVTTARTTPISTATANKLGPSDKRNV